MEKKEINILDYLLVLAKWKKVLIINFLVISVLALILSLCLPRWYRSSTVILAPTDESGALSLSSLIGNIPMGGFLSSNLSDETNLFLAILNSRTLMDSLITKFDLRARYKTKTNEKTIKKLSKRIKSKVNEDGTIEITVVEKTRFLPSKKDNKEVKQLVFDMNQYLLKILDRTNRSIKTDKARNYRLSIEKRYFQNLDDLYKAENEFKNFQKEHGTIAMEEQTKATIEAMAQLNAQAVLKEIDLEVKKSYLGPNHYETIKDKNEIKALNEKISDLNSGIGMSASDDSTRLFIPLAKVPDLGIQYARLFREIKLQETLMEFILPQYEQAKLQEAKDTPTVQLLDPPQIPERKFKPKKAFFIIAWAFVGLVFSVIFIFGFEYFQGLKETDHQDYKKISKILDEFRIK